MSAGSFAGAFVTIAMTATIAAAAAAAAHIMATADPTKTLAIYAQILRRADRDQLRAQIRELLGVDGGGTTQALLSGRRGESV